MDLREDHRASHDPMVEKYATQIVGIKDGRVSMANAGEAREGVEK